MDATADDETLTGTKARIVDAALETLKTKGFAGCSAREIARAGHFNQALVFYHFGSVRNLLLAALDVVSARRMRAYRSRFERAGTVSDLATLAREIYDEDLENGYVTVLGEMVAGGVSDAALGAEVVARLQPWMEMVERKVHALLENSVFGAMVAPSDVAHAIIALYFGIDMLSQLERDRARAQSLLDLGIRYAPIVDELVLREGPDGP